MSRRKSNKKVKQMICDCHVNNYRDMELLRVYWKGIELQQAVNWTGRGFSRFYVTHYKPLSLTADQLQ